MKKLILKAIVAFSVLIVFQSCSKDESSFLIGFWVESNKGYGGCTSSFEFINHNTVIEYGMTMLTEYQSHYSGAKNNIPHPCDSRYCCNPNPKTWTYELKDNKVIITSGWVFTIIDEKLYRDGTSLYFIKP